MLQATGRQQRSKGWERSLRDGGGVEGSWQLVEGRRSRLLGIA